MLSTILFAVVVAAIVVGATAASLRVSSWWLFMVACVVAAPLLVAAHAETARDCSSPATSLLPDSFAVTCLAVSLTLYGAAVVDGVVDGARRRGEQAVGAWFMRSIVCPLASGGGAFVLFIAVLSAALHCD